MSLSQSRLNRLADVAEMYYIKGLTVEQVGRITKMSRSTVSRMLAQSRALGLIEIHVHRQPGTITASGRIQRRYGVSCSVASLNTSESAGELDKLRQLAVGRKAAQWLGVIAQSGMTISVAWGSTVEAMSAQLSRLPIRDVKVIQMHGSSSTSGPGASYVGTILNRFGMALNAHVYYFPVPAILDTPEAKQALWKEKSIQRVLKLREAADLLITSVGISEGEHPGRLYRDFTNAEDLKHLHDNNVIGNLCSVFFRSDATTNGISINQRTTGMPFNKIRHIPYRLLIAADPNKADAIHTILSAGLITHLVIDSDTASELLKVNDTNTEVSDSKIDNQQP